MKKIIYFFAGVCFFASCNQKESETEGTTSGATETAATVPAADKAKPVYSYPVRYTDWEIGNPEHTKTVLDFYYAWDHQDLNKLVNLFADTVILRIPTERDEIVVPNNKINEKLKANRGMYDSTSNSVISAVSLHDRESNEDWVMVTTYSKWIEKGGKRDSVLYHDNWRLKDGKLKFLMSFYKLPTKTFVQRNDPK
jgi:ketosteroid isomerase-like protein